MSQVKPSRRAAAGKRKLQEAIDILKALGFGPKQSNEVAAYLKGLGVVIAPSAKMPDVVVHDTKKPASSSPSATTTC